VAIRGGVGTALVRPISASGPRRHRRFPEGATATSRRRSEEKEILIRFSEILRYPIRVGISDPEINIRAGFVDKIVIAFFLTSAIFIPLTLTVYRLKKKHPPHAGIKRNQSIASSNR
jgi:hypothetical protein